MPTTPRPRFRAQALGGSLLHHVPNRPPWFPISTPPPGPSTHPSGFSVRSQRGSIGFNPTAFKAPVPTSVATEFNPGEQLYYIKTMSLKSSREPPGTDPAFPKGQKAKNRPFGKESKMRGSVPSAAKVPSLLAEMRFSAVLNLKES